LLFKSYKPFSPVATSQSAPSTLCASRINIDINIDINHTGREKKKMSASNTPLRSDVGAPQSSLDDPANHHANGGSSSKNPNGEHSLGGFQAQNKMAVQPPREDDLQQSYATVVRTDADHKGWYGGMSKFMFLFLFVFFSLAPCSILRHAPHNR
jgi:hypothetical protein